MIKIATWNVNSIRARLPHLTKWLGDAQPDVLLLQETKVEDKDFPLTAFETQHYHLVYTGQKSYNGMAIVSRYPFTELETQFTNHTDAARRMMAVTVNGIRIVNVYVPNGEAVGSEKFAYKLEWLHHLQQYLQGQIKKYPYVLVAGDFNVAPEGLDVYDPSEYHDCVLVSEPEREAFRSIIALGFNDSFRQFQKESGQFSWWDYRAAAFRRNRGLRIDHILINAALAACCRSCDIDKEPRGWERPSDHTPVFANFEIP